MNPAWVADVLRFWFDELTPTQWFRSTPELDAQIAARFEALHVTLSATPPRPEDLDGEGHVAAVIALDQLPRNLFRGTARAFATDPIARAFAEDAVARGLDRGLPAPHRQFLYMPFMHSEDPAHQEQSLLLFASLGVPPALQAAQQHHATIARFGRFPYRNAALGRASTPEERAFLKSEPHPS